MFVLLVLQLQVLTWAFDNRQKGSTWSDTRRPPRFFFRFCWSMQSAVFRRTWTRKTPSCRSWMINREWKKIEGKTRWQLFCIHRQAEKMTCAQHRLGRISPQVRARSHRREKRAGMKVALPTLTCQAHVTFPPRFIRYFRWKPCQAGTFPPDKTLYRKYRIESGGQKLRTASRSVFLSFLTLSRRKIGDGKKYSSGSRSLEQFFFLIDAESCLRHSEGCRAPPLLPCRSAEQIHARKPMGTSSRVRKRSGVTDAVISAFVSSSFAKWRRGVLQRRKNTVLRRQLPLDVAAPL